VTRYRKDSAKIRSDARPEHGIAEAVQCLARQIGEFTDRLAEVTEQIAAQTANINKLVEVTNQDTTAIRQLAAIALRHEQRLDNLDSGQ
jgi:DNA anti-recombination protein RmuC